MNYNLVDSLREFSEMRLNDSFCLVPATFFGKTQAFWVDTLQGEISA